MASRELPTPPYNAERFRVGCSPARRINDGIFLPFVVVDRTL